MSAATAPRTDRHVDDDESCSVVTSGLSAGGLGSDRSAGAADGGDDDRLSGPAHRVVPTGDGVGRVARVAPVRRPRHQHRPGLHVGGCGRASPHRGLQDRPRRPARPRRRHRRPPRPSATTSGCCAPSSSGSSTGTTPTHHDESRCSPATCRKRTSRCRSSSTTPPRRSSWPPWPSNRTGGAGSSSSCWPAPGCASARSAGCATTPCIASATPTGCASRSASCTTNAPSRCTRCSSG